MSGYCSERALRALLVFSLAVLKAWGLCSLRRREGWHVAVKGALVISLQCNYVLAPLSAVVPALAILCMISLQSCCSQVLLEESETCHTEIA